jgi:tetratricopeptide (TPR) repeat protein
MSGVFISYRRDDSAAAAGRLYDRLAAHFGKEQVFRDLDAIAPGAEFGKVIEERIAQSDVLIAVIGKEWLNVTTAEGQRRLDDPNDYVKAEIREALNQKKLVIPALIAGANVPKAEQLPEDIAALAGRNAIEISESRFDFDASRMIEAAEKAGVPPRSSSETQSAPRQGWWARINNENNQRTWKFIGGGIAAVVPAVWALYVYLDGSPTVQPTKPGQTVTAVDRGVAAGGNVTAAAGGIVNTGSNNTFNIGITLEQHESRLKQREQEIRAEVRAELAQANGADKARVALLEKQLATAEAKRQNPEQSLAETSRTFAGVNDALEKLKGDLPADQLAQAKQALQKGDPGAAKTLFANVVQSGKQQAAEAAFQLGKLAHDRIDYVTAHQYYLEAARLQPENAAYLNMVARINHEMGRYQEALPFLVKALAIREKSLGPHHPDVAQSLNNLAELYRIQGEYAKAEPLYQRSLMIWESSLGPDHPDVAASLNNVALLYEAQGQYVKAEPLYQRSLKIREKSLGADHPDVATGLNNLAELYRVQGQYAKAEPLYQRSLRIWEKSLGLDHPDVAVSLNNLAELYRIQGQYAKAEPLHQRSLRIWEKSLGPEHPQVATSLNNLAELYRVQGRYAKAVPLYQRSLKILEKSLGPEHPHVATSLNNLALLYEARAEYANAEPLYQRSLNILEKSLGRDHPDVAASLNNLALLYKARAEYAKAEPLHQRSLKIWEKSLGPEHPQVATSLNNLATLYYAQGQHAKAEPLYQRSLKIWEKSLGPDHPNLAKSLENYAELLGKTGNTKEASRLAARAQAIRGKHQQSSVGGDAKNSRPRNFQQ